MGAPVVTSVEGSHMAHAIYTLAEGGFHMDMDTLKRRLDLIDQQRRPGIVS